MKQTLSQQPPAPHLTSEISSVTPIHALSLISLDTETTGLDTERDRIIQIGAVNITRGTLDSDFSYDVLINPEQHIPSLSTKFHGIVDSDVVDSPKFYNVTPELTNLLEHSIILGYSIGFDLAMLKREYELAGSNWNAPRAIDVRYLVDFLSPELPDQSLDTVASWLGVEVVDRHNALADARITAEIFLSLLPQLRDNGIRTLAELENACKSDKTRAKVEAKSGWYDFLGDTDQDPVRRARTHIDTYPYQHRITDVMSTPVTFADSDQLVCDALATLMDKHISSVIIKPSSDRSNYGILTERDILRAIDEHGSNALKMKIDCVASYPLLSIKDHEYLFRAMGRMERQKLRHLAVVNTDQNIIGMLTSRDMIRQKVSDAINIGDAINLAESEQDLAAAWANLTLAVISLDREAVDIRDIAAVISGELQALTRRCCIIAEREMLDNGMGHPPVPYAMLVLGSGGRGESLLAMDQDNAIVYRKGKPGSNIDQWFEQLALRVTQLLNDTGVPYCKGNIMASNPQWRMSVNNWKSLIRTWVKHTSPEDALKIDIFFDGVSVYGDQSLADEILNYAYKLGRSSQLFLSLMEHYSADANPPIGLFGRFKLEKGRVDIKKGGLLPIFTAARTESIRHGIKHNATPDRLYALIDQGRPTILIERLVGAQHIILTAILKQQLYDLQHGIPLSCRIAPNKMNPVLRNNLKWALEQVPSVSELVNVLV